MVTTRMRWARLLWGVELRTAPRGAPVLLGSLWALEPRGDA